MADSVISASSTLRGNVSGAGSLRVEGRIRGDVSVTGDVWIGRQAQVAGNISGASLTIEGAVAGDLTATVALSLETTARVVGDLSAPQIGIGDGALVRGRIETEGAGAAPARAGSSARSNQATRTASAPRTSTATRPVTAPRAASTAAPARRPVPPSSASKPVAPAATVESKSAAKDAQLDLNQAKPGKARKLPPPPTVSAPRKGAKGRKKAAKR